jgi:hypothetical protein
MSDWSRQTAGHKQIDILSRSHFKNIFYRDLQLFHDKSRDLESHFLIDFLNRINDLNELNSIEISNHLDSDLPTGSVNSFNLFCRLLCILLFQGKCIRATFRAAFSDSAEVQYR